MEAKNIAQLIVAIVLAIILVYYLWQFYQNPHLLGMIKGGLDMILSRL